MASYQSRRRDPLLDSTTQAALEKRTRELLGLGLIALGVLVAAMIGSYSPDDPSWISATDAPVQNWLGYFGASLAAPIIMIVGVGAWVLPLVLLTWGLRFVMHMGQERALGRLLAIALAIVVAPLHLATLTPFDGWAASFGLGGLFGDTVLGVVLTILPIGAAFGVKVLSLLTGIALLALLAFAMGFSREELRTAGRFVFLGTVMLYDMLMRGLGRGAVLSAQAAKGVGSAVQARRAQYAQTRAAVTDADETEDDLAAFRVPPLMQDRGRTASVVRANPVMPKEPPLTAPKPAPKMPGRPPLAAPLRAPSQGDAPAGGFLASLLKRNDPMPEPELVTPEPRFDDTAMGNNSDRVSARIADAIKNRQPRPSPTGVRIEPALTAGKGPKPLIFAAPAQAAAPQVDLLDDEDDGFDYAAPHMPIPEVKPAPVETGFADAYAQPDLQSRSVVQHPLKRAPQPSRQARAEAQPALKFDDRYGGYEKPALSLLMNPVEITRHHLSDEALEANARMLESVLDDYGVKGDIVSVRPGPVVTMYELEPAPGLKASRVIGLSDDIARSMSALSARVSTVPGRSVIGIELPNENREKVVLREILSHRDFGDGNHKLPLALGKDIGGEPIIANLAKMPHLLIAGTTGSGKSVAINTMILSLLYKLSPEECRMIMIDPKMLELSVYDGIPHLLSPVVTDPKKAVVALKWVVGEMEERYRKMSKMG
ncbi:DNA translocase FtsK, partial [Yoonia sp.]|uniref:DNA translocase FtsK n=1 Tax=Yoonia sp. TaxID=2212373 RepID=UPI002FD8F0E2